jgi:hypothetical protein
VVQYAGHKILGDSVFPEWVYGNVANVCDGYEITATAIAVLIAVIVPSGSDGRQQTHESRKRGHGFGEARRIVYSIASSEKM